MSEALTAGQVLDLVRVVFADADIVSSQPFPGPHANRSAERSRRSLNYDLCLANPAVNVVLKVYLDMSMRRPWKETHLLRLLTSETGVPTPSMLHFDDSLDQIPHPWALHTRLPGQPLHDMLGTLTWEDLATIGYEAGRYLGRIHQIPLDVFGEFWPDASHVPGPHQHAADQSIRHEKAYLLSQVAPWLEACAGQALLPAETIEALGQLFARTELLDRGQACLIHGAYDAHSVIVERGTTGYHVTGILDLEHAIGGSPELDMSYFLGYRFEQETAFQGERVRKEFLDGYAESGEIRADFWDRLRIYQLFTCLRCISARPQADPKTEAMPWHCTDSPEREMCRRWIHRNLEQLEHSI